MKILIKTQDIKNKSVMLKGLELAKTWASTIGFNFQYDFEEFNQNYTIKIGKNIQGIDCAWIKPEDILKNVPKGYKIVCLVHSDSETTNPFQHPIEKNGANPIQIPESWFDIYPEVFAQYFLHEICHSGFYFAKNITNDITHDQQKFPQWQQKQLHEYYLHLLKDLKQYLEPVIIDVMPTLRLRSTNKQAVGILQGYLDVTVDGDFGLKTLKALKDFQKLNNLVVDGICGSKVWAELKKKIKKTQKIQQLELKKK